MTVQLSIGIMETNQEKVEEISRQGKIADQKPGRHVGFENALLNWVRIVKNRPGWLKYRIQSHTPIDEGPF
jgi:hypothetical protein